VTASAAIEGGPAARTERGFPCLDGARAVAATAVVGTHAAFWAGDQTQDAVGRVFNRLDVGVPIFFVLSGFLLARPIFRAAGEGRPGPRTAAYLWRRAVRILPAYWLTVVAALLLLPDNAEAGPAVWLRQLTLGQMYAPGGFAAGLSHTWSLGTEVAFYLVLPLAGAGLVRLARRTPHRPGRVLAALAGAAVLGAVWVAWIWAARPVTAPLEQWLPAFVGWFGAGMALAVLSVADPGWRPARAARELAAGLGTCWAGAAVLFWIATSPVAGESGVVALTPAQAVVRNLLYLGIAALFVLPLVLADPRDGVVRRALASPPARFLGEISYGIFLVHVVLLAGGYAALGWAPFTGNVVLVFLGTWIAAVLVATAVYLIVERPLSRWRPLVADRSSEPRPGSTAATSALSATSASN
jgi:peptidoglycan/LPS O-acetylase OafA/YrhL